MRGYCRIASKFNTGWLQKGRSDGAYRFLYLPPRSLPVPGCTSPACARGKPGPPRRFPAGSRAALCAARIFRFAENSRGGPAWAGRSAQAAEPHKYHPVKKCREAVLGSSPLYKWVCGVWGLLCPMWANALLRKACRPATGRVGRRDSPTALQERQAGRQRLSGLSAAHGTRRGCSPPAVRRWGT